MTTYIKGFKIRIYPTKRQEEMMWQHVGSSRFIYNHMLAIQKQRYENKEKHLSRFDMNRLLTPLKKEEGFEWLSDVSNTMLQITCHELSKAYKKLFKKTASPPRFKSRKRSKSSFPVSAEKVYFTPDKTVNVEKIGKVKFKTDFVFAIGRGAVKVSNARISYHLGKWYLSFGMQVESQDCELTSEKMGIDLGIKELAVVAVGGDDYKFENINKSSKVRKLKQRLKKTQRSISRKYEANKCGRTFVKTKNIEKLEEEARRLHGRIAGIRNNQLHQTTHFLTSLLPSRVTMEDLNIRGMMKNRHLSRAIGEMCWYEFMRQMEYKCAWKGIEFVKVPRNYPSSKTCSCCGNVNRNLKLKDRTYVCDVCGLSLDRDLNAAVNLMQYEAC